MTIKRWLAAGAMLATAALPAALGVVANDLGPDNQQAKHGTATLAGDPDDGGQISFTAVLAEGKPPVIKN